MLVNTAATDHSPALSKSILSTMLFTMLMLSRCAAESEMISTCEDVFDQGTCKELHRSGQCETQEAVQGCAATCGACGGSSPCDGVVVDIDQYSGDQCIPPFLELTTDLLNCYCKKNTGQIDRTLDTAHYCSLDDSWAEETNRIRVALANKMFFRCKSWCLFDVDEPSTRFWIYNRDLECYKRAGKRSLCKKVVDDNGREFNHVLGRSAKTCYVGPFEAPAPLATAAPITEPTAPLATSAPITEPQEAPLATAAPITEHQTPLATSAPVTEPQEEAPLPTHAPTESKATPPPTGAPTEHPTPRPTESPTKKPTDDPTSSPTKEPTDNPTRSPTKEPTDRPTRSPTKKPTDNPTSSPTKEPTDNPTPLPTKQPTDNPTSSPTKKPTDNPTRSPTRAPTPSPTESPTQAPIDPPPPATTPPQVSTSPCDGLVLNHRQRSGNQCIPRKHESELTTDVLGCYCESTGRVDRTKDTAHFCTMDDTDVWNEETARIRLALANRMFHTCNSWCLFDVDEPTTKFWLYNQFQRCYKRQGKKGQCQRVVDQNGAQINFVQERSASVCPAGNN